MKLYLTEKEEFSVRKITDACNRADGTSYSAPLDADEYFLSCHGGEPVAFLAVYRMGDTVEGRPVDELMLFTHPSFREHHRGRKLLERYENRRELPVLRFSAYPAAITESFLQKLRAQHVHDELLMTRALPGPSEKRRRRLKEQDYTLRNEYSECSVKTYGTVGYIYGVRTDESHLREGSAERLLKTVFDRLSELGADAAVLEVSSANTPAYRLYRKLGFTVTQTLQIWQRL